MQIEYKKLSELNPYKNNPRKNDQAVDAVANSIREFGFKVPVVIDKNGEIIAGHTRYKAAKKLKLKEIPCIIADDLTEEQIKAFRLADNKVGELAEWDLDMLDIELDEITEIDMEQFGFYMSDMESEAEAIEDDFDATPPEEPVARFGQIYKLGRHRLMCGDSTDPECVKKLVGENADLLLTDPPYGIDIVQGKHIGGRGKTHFDHVEGEVVKVSDYIPVKGDDTTETAKKAVEIAQQITKNQIIFGGNYFTDFLFPSSCWCVWDKENTGNFADVEMAWTSFNKGAKLYRWLWNGLSRKGDRKTEGKTRVHPTQKPVGLFGEILKDFSEENDSVLDLFGGSGSTLIACEQLDRTCYMMEYEPHYIDVIIKRWEEFTGRKAELIEGDTDGEA